ncbi:haloacid dehalogenase superfamily, subfamily IA, variant 3 with third motif having DD or ED [Parapedobacter indicus]|uniref:Haloacid dehalogenase superfamily, subfamily IA, variant 3 with third motif having DD or ED n=2 Tax=Parapedobacter indicus TaxID=1477437 RepID=A0A1I3UGD6_9SPHI|nr:HAD superfamily hydrolase (TIGR01509 family) [Parapedobacter indicus]SFJ80871.1 haloacid dehalogenase superfamily, subfamily IA, variant 3 with third motif having DD or ED [Parapedobacter indicus]
MNVLTMDKITSIIFDCDGVLVDTERAMISVLLEMTLEFGVNMELDEAVKAFSGRQILETIAALQTSAGRPFPENFEQDFRVRAYDRFRQGIEAVPGIHELLDRLKVPYCVASSGPKEKIALNLKLTGLLGYFPEHHIFSSYEINSWKPDPGIFLHAADFMGFHPHTTAVVEDSIAGVEAAVKGGFKVFAIANEQDRHELAARGATTFGHMRELPDLLKL